MKFNITTAYYTVLKFAKSLKEISDGPTKNHTIFYQICNELHIKKKELDKFRVNLYFAWQHNTNDFKEKIQRALRANDDNGLIDNYIFQNDLQSDIHGDNDSDGDRDSEGDNVNDNNNENDRDNGSEGNNESIGDTDGINDNDDNDNSVNSVSDDDIDSVNNFSDDINASHDNNDNDCDNDNDRDNESDFNDDSDFDNDSDCNSDYESPDDDHNKNNQLIRRLSFLLLITLEENYSNNLSEENNSSNSYILNNNSHKNQKNFHSSDSNTKNNYKSNSVEPKLREVQKSEYKFVDRITISSAKISKNNFITPDLLYQHLRQNLPIKNKISCILIFGDGLKFTKTKSTFRIRATCKQPECNLKFKFNGEFHPQKTTIKIYSNESAAIHTVPLNYQLRGNKRKQLQKILCHVKPSTVGTEVVKKMDKNLAIKEKNYQFKYSAEVLQKAKSEKLAENDRHTDDCADIVLRMNQYNSDHTYIRHFFNPPFTVYLAMEEQIQLLMDNGDLKLYFDATGSTVRKPFKQSNSVYYYAGVVNINQEIYPLIEMITNDHTTESIAKCLDYFKELWNFNKITMPLVRYVVTDWSWASINAIMKSWNNCTVLDYLNTTYDCLQKNQLLPKKITPLFTCYSHFMKTVFRQLKTLRIKLHISAIYLDIAAIIVYCQTFDTIVNHLESFFHILLSLKKNYTVAKNLKSFTNVTPSKINPVQVYEENVEQVMLNDQFCNLYI